MTLLQLPAKQLFTMAQAQRIASFGNEIQLCAIISIRAGQCNMDCKFCSQHSRAIKLPAELLPEAKIMDQIKMLAAQPVSRIGLVSSGGILPDADFKRICSLLADLPANVLAKICCSFGRLPLDKLKALKSVGITRYHHNLETSSRFYPEICTTQSWAQRREVVKNALSIGLEVCSGALFGIGETWQDRIDLAKELKNLGVEDLPLNFLYPQQNTEFGASSPLTADEALRIIALYRYLLPYATLRVCGGRPTTFGQRQKEIFAAGANALMTGNYLTTHGESIAKDLTMLAELGLTPQPAPSPQGR